jgi:hypothetical protein
MSQAPLAGLALPARSKHIAGVSVQYDVRLIPAALAGEDEVKRPELVNKESALTPVFWQGVVQAALKFV